MYFEISNSPVNAKQKKSSDDDEEVVLKLAPFSTTPTITFENVPVNIECTKCLKILNPKPERLLVSVSKRPDELGITLSWYEKYLEPREVAPLMLSWCPKKPIAQRFTMQICEKRTKYDVFIVCKCVNKKNVQKVIKNKSKPIGIKKSPVRTTVKTKIKTNVILETFKKKEFGENVTYKQKTVTDSYSNYASFSSMSNLQRNDDNSNNRRDTYLISDNDPFIDDFLKENVAYEPTPKKAPKNRPFPDFRILSPIENMQFSPLKVHRFKKTVNNYRSEEEITFKQQYNENYYEDIDVSPLIKYPLRKTDDFETFNIDESIEKDITSINHVKNLNREIICDMTGIESISPLIKYSFADTKQNKEFPVKIFNLNGDYERKIPSISINQVNLDATHPIIDLADDSYVSKDQSIDLQLNKFANLENEVGVQTPCNKINDQIDNSLCFNPKRCSTEKKSLGNSFDKDLSLGNFKSSETFTKADSPIIPLNPEKDNHLHSSPYSLEKSPVDDHKCPKTLFGDNLQNFNERYNLRNSYKEKNDINSARSIIEADLWTKSPPTNPVQLQTIFEEPSIVYSEISSCDTNKKFETFILDRTYDAKTKPIEHPVRKKWNKVAVNREPIFHKVSHTETLKTKEINTRIVEKSSHTLDVYVKATTIDPFLATTCLYDEEAFDKLEKEFKHWLNYLLTPPTDLDTKLDVDVGKVWIENRNKTVPVAPTKEQVSAKYHTSHRLESLRKTAKSLIKTPEITQVFLKVTSQIERKLLSIRTDKNLHLDIGLQKYVLSLLLCYNPLWLRIGLEALYDKPIPLASNDDFSGLSEFITDHMFRDPYVSAKHLLIQPSYAENLKKFTLKKFLFLVYFLDQAKKNKIIFHDPCLFCRNSQFKESRQILFQFSKELLSGVGDITKHLKPTGYVVSHKQTPLNEFKYAVHNLATDLKDGIRLVKLMEIILLKENLTTGLRMPAISRLQKIHNVQIALTALATTDFKIVGDITARDIVDGHREKTLSLLWQLIHKFRAPLFENASITIQKWWKRKYLKISIEKRIEKRKVQKLHIAAYTIQSWWRNIQLKKRYLMQLSIETKASIVIQKNWRMWKCKSYYDDLKKSTIIIQRMYRDRLIIRDAKIKLEYLRRNRSALLIQSWYKKMKIRKILKAQNRDREHFLQLKSSVLKMQCLFRANLNMKKERIVYVKLKISTVKIQRFYRSVVRTRIVRKQFLALKASAVVVQNRYRANLEMRKCKEEYEVVKSAILKIQQYYRNYVTMKKCRDNFEKTRNAVVNIQRFYRNYLLNKKVHSMYLDQKKSAIAIQRYYRSYIEMKTIRNQYLIKKIAVVKIQCIFRSYVLMKKQREDFLTLKKAAISIQRYYKAKRLMENDKLRFDHMKYSAIIIQRYYRSFILTKSVRKEYLQKKKMVICMQRRFRYNKEQNQKKKMFDSAVKIQRWLKSIWSMRKVRKDYLELRTAAIRIQRMYKSKILMKREQQSFRDLKNACVFIQRFYRAKKETQMLRCKFLETSRAVNVIQNRFRAYRLMKMEREKYLTLKRNVIYIQATYRKNKLARETQLKYHNLRSACVLIQSKYRALKAMKNARENYLNCKKSAIVIQNYYRSYVLMKQMRNQFLLQKRSTVIIQSCFRMYLKRKRERNAACTVIQRYYRAYMLKKQNRYDYLEKLNAIIKIQRFYRSYKIMQSTKREYLQLKNATIIIQKFYRNYKVTCECRSTYLNVIKSVKLLQEKYRAKLLARKVRNDFQLQKNSAITIQRMFRSYLLMKEQRKNYSDLLKYTLIVQRRFRNKLLTENLKNEYTNTKTSIIKIQSYYRMYVCRRNYLKMKNAAIIIQQFYRNYKVTCECRSTYLNVIKSVKFIQEKYRAKLLARNVRNYVQLQKNSAITIQRMFRSYLLMKEQRNKYLDLLKYTLIVQRRFRNKILTENLKKEYTNTKTSVVKIQSYYRMYVCRKNYLKMKNASIIIQQFYRNYKVTCECRSTYLNVTKSVKFLQEKYRAKLLARKVRNDYQLQKNSAITIQRIYRSYLLMKEQRNKYLDLLKYTVIVQRRFRNKLLTENLKKEYANMKTSIIKIQSYYRMYVCRRNYLKLKNSTIIIQRFYRNYKVTCEYRSAYLNVTKSVKFVQEKYRAKLLAKKVRNDFILQRNSAITIQRMFRSYLSMKEQRNKYLDLLKYTLIVQRRFRNKILTENLKKEYTYTKTSIIKIQSFYRMYICRRNYLKLKNAASTIQNYYRAYTLMRNYQTEYRLTITKIIVVQKTVRKWLVQRKYETLRNAAIKIQRNYRKMLESKENERRNAAALKIQSFWRAYVMRKKYAQLKRSVIYCQTRRRAILQMRQTKESYQRIHKGIVRLQALIRGYLCRQNIQAKKMNIQSISMLRLHIRAIVKIQAYWRGYKVRKLQDENSSIKKLRRRWQKGALNRQSTQLTIAERNSDVLSTFVWNSGPCDMASAIRVFKTLDFVTDVYPMLYRETAGIISKRLIDYMNGSNRSVSTLESLNLGVAILLNLTRYNPTSGFVYSTENIDIILKLMSIWCGIDNYLSRSFCTLLWLFGKYKNIRSDLTTFLRVPKSYKILCKVRSAIIREKRMNSNRRYSQTPVKSAAKLNMSILNNTTIVNGNSNLPMTEPDFGIIRTSRPKIFHDELYAINCIFKRYNLPFNT